MKKATQISYIRDEMRSNRIHRRKNRTCRNICMAAALLCLTSGLFFLFSNLLMICREDNKIQDESKLKDMDADCILVLGAGVWAGGVPSNMLADRLDEGLRLYQNGVSDKILVSGDHGRKNYDEVNVMKKYLMERGVPGEDIFMDHAGFTTYESMYRAKEVFGVKKAVVVTQRYHLYRALYICEKMKIGALGSASDPRSYRGAFVRNVRESLSRVKAVIWCFFKMKPKYLGEPIDIHGDGNVTNDKAE